MKRSLLLLIPLITSSAFATDKEVSRSTNAESSTTNIVQEALYMPTTRAETSDFNQFAYSPTTDKANQNRGGSDANASTIEHIKAFLSKESTDSAQQLIDSHRLTKKEKIAVRNKIKTIKISNDIRSRFNSLFSKWEHFINTDSKIIYSSNLGDRKQSEYYSQLLQMGKDILPLVVDKMLDEKYFYAIILYDDLQNNDPRLCYKAGDKTTAGVIGCEQTRAARTVLKWYRKASDSK